MDAEVIAHDAHREGVLAGLVAGGSRHLQCYVALQAPAVHKFPVHARQPLACLPDRVVVVGRLGERSP
jgi:hypothetical protein